MLFQDEFLWQSQNSSGSNFLHQLKLIVDVLGTPPPDLLKLSRSNAVPKFIAGTLVLHNTQPVQCPIEHGEAKS